MKKIVALSALSMGILFLAGCGQQPWRLSQTQSGIPVPVAQMPTQPVIPASDETAGWQTYTNPTFGYSIKYPATWTEKQGKILEAGASEDKKNVAIEFYNNNVLTLRITADYKTKRGDPSLSSLASEVPAPADKTTISGSVAYKVGSLDGYRRLVVVSDPVSQGLEYITKDSKYIYHMSTFDKTESTEVVNMLKTFTTATNNAVTQPVVKSNKPIITYPANASAVDGVTIKGTAKPNSEIWAYVNYPKNELACISINSYASGGGSTVDSIGNFEFALAEPCGRELSIVVSTEEPAADKTGACRSSENVSEPITFTNSGELPGICNQ